MKNMMTRKTPGLKARGRAARLAVFAAGSSLGARTVRLSETGDLHLPETVTADTPCLLLIHGGGWAAMSRRDVVGIADYFAKDLGFVVYNVDYRLASPEHPWPACGEDCAAAARSSSSRTAWRVRRGQDDNPWTLRPTLYSGPSAYDPLQPSGLLGPVRLMVFDRQ